VLSRQLAKFGSEVEMDAPSAMKSLPLQPLSERCFARAGWSQQQYCQRAEGNDKRRVGGLEGHFVEVRYLPINSYEAQMNQWLQYDTVLALQLHTMKTGREPRREPAPAVWLPRRNLELGLPMKNAFIFTETATFSRTGPRWREVAAVFTGQKFPGQVRVWCAGFAGAKQPSRIRESNHATCIPSGAEFCNTHSGSGEVVVGRRAGR
jgi:hypothetical protein